MVAFTGHRKLVVKSDGEPAITAPKDAIQASCGLDSGVEVGPVGDSKLNGEIEGPVERRKGNPEHYILPWARNVRPSSARTVPLCLGWRRARRRPIDKFTLGADGKTAHGRCRERRLSNQLPEFSDGVMHLKPPPLPPLSPMQQGRET